MIRDLLIRSAWFVLLYASGLWLVCAYVSRRRRRRMERGRRIPPPFPCPPPPARPPYSCGNPIHDSLCAAAEALGVAMARARARARRG